jgi:hypothetical protein
MDSDQGHNSDTGGFAMPVSEHDVHHPPPPLHPQSDGMVDSYIKTVEEHLQQKVSASHQRDWAARLSIFLLA